MSRALFLPEGSEIVAKDETILWEGRPLVAGLARQVFHIRAVMGYFFVLAAWNLASTHADGFRANAALLSAAWVVLPAVIGASVIYAMSWVFVATTHYTITDKRVIMQIGVAVPIALTLPLRQIAGADVKLYMDGSGDIPLALGQQKLAYLLVWPHARPWRFKTTEPMLRAVPNARDVATILTRALSAVSPGGEVVAVEAARRPEPRGERGIATA
jgi:hypothetical protein